MLARHAFLYCLLLVGALLSGCKPQVEADTTLNDSLPDVIPIVDPDAKQEGSGLAELLIDPGDMEIVNLDSRDQAVSPDEPGPESDGTATEQSSTAVLAGGTSGIGMLDTGAPDGDAPDVNTSDTSTRQDAPSASEDFTGMRRLPGQYVTIITDLPSGAEVNELALVFDKAVAEWRKYFGIPIQNRRVKFSMTGYVMRSKERFQRQGLLPKDLPPFLHGYQRGDEFWVYDQPSAYFRRHLVLHEGTHGFMEKFLGGTGAPWYREGLADFLATHSWNENRLQLGYMPKSREEVPYWGRIKLVKEAFAQGQALMIQEVMRLETRDYAQVDAYAWSWAAAAFLDSDPMFRQPFRSMQTSASDNTVRFTRKFEQLVINQLRELDESWQLFIANIEYGYDFERFAVVREPGRPIPGTGAEVTIQANRGWQSTGYRVERGKNYLIRASGQCVVQSAPEVWPAEPDGITLRYYQGEPLGRLLGNIRLDQARPGLANLVTPMPIGLGRIVQPDAPGTLYLRINDSPAELADNVGEFTVRINPRDLADGEKTVH